MLIFDFLSREPKRMDGAAMWKKMMSTIYAVTLILATISAISSGCSKSPNSQDTPPTVEDDLSSRLAEALDNWHVTTGIRSLADIRNDQNCNQQPNAADAHSLLYREVSRLDKKTVAFLKLDFLETTTLELKRGLDAHHGLIKDIKAASRLACCQWYSFLQQSSWGNENTLYADQATRLLKAEAIYQFRTGKIEPAMDSVEANLLLADQIQLDPFMTSFAIGVAMEGNIIDVLIEFLAEHDIDTSSIIAIFAGQDQTAKFARMIAVEYALAISQTNKDTIIDDQAPLVADGLSDQTILRIIDILDASRVFIADARKPRYLRSSASPPALPDELNSKDYDIVVLLEQLTKFVDKANIKRTMLLFALELRRHRSDTGSYPNPDDIEIPIDTADGKPLSYELLPTGGFILRSSASFDIDDEQTKLEIQWD